MRTIGALFLFFGALVNAEQANFYSPEKEAALGRQLASEFAQRSTPVASPAAQDYVEQLGRRLAAQVPGARFAFTFAVIQEDRCKDHEPPAFPGGYVFVPADLVKEARDEAEFAGMLAHAMAHSALSHGMRPSVTTASVPLIFVGGWAGSCAARLAVPLAFRASMDKLEQESDAAAIQATTNEGFDPAGLLRYLEHVEAPEDRLSAIRRQMQQIPPAAYSPQSPQFSAMQEEVRRLTVQPRRQTPPPSLYRH